MTEPDPQFADARLAVLYDDIDGPRDDLTHYVALAAELDARTVVDIGCGTGTLASMLGERGVDVVGVDPAAASLDVAERKCRGLPVTLVLGTASDIVPRSADLVVMTGNVAQVFVEDDEWDQVLTAAADLVRPGGWLVFETRDPARRAWEGWTTERTRMARHIDGIGVVEYSVQVISVVGPLVTFVAGYRFADGTVLHSQSTLRFRDREEIADSLGRAGWDVMDVRDAPDRAGLELVFVARRAG